MKQRQRVNSWLMAKSQHNGGSARQKRQRRLSWHMLAAISANAARLLVSRAYHHHYHAARSINSNALRHHVASIVALAATPPILCNSALANSAHSGAAPNINK